MLVGRVDAIQRSSCEAGYKPLSMVGPSYPMYSCDPKFVIHSSMKTPSLEADSVMHLLSKI